jgi:tetratricopeptide (TPR) repeat protein
VKAPAALVYRALLIAGCAFAVWRSVQFARADWAASQNTIAAIERAIQYSPDDPRLLARLTIAQSDAGDQRPGLDAQLRRIALLDPFNSDVLMTLGLREEFAGNKAAAARELTRATEIDHQFKPAWTLANFYDRMGEPARALPMIERILNLDPLGFNPGPVFELGWRVAGNKPGIVLDLVPKKDSRPIQYLAFLMSTQRTDAALQAWPKALAAVDPQNAGEVGALSGLVDFFASTGHLSDAVAVWNHDSFRASRSGERRVGSGSRFSVPCHRTGIRLASE